MATCDNLITNEDLANYKKDAEYLGLTVESPNHSETTPNGQLKRTITGINQDADNAIRNAGGVPLGDGQWGAGKTYNAYNEYLTFNGVPYKPLNIPYTTQGADPTQSPDLENVQPYTNVSKEYVDNEIQDVKDESDTKYILKANNGAYLGYVFKTLNALVDTQLDQFGQLVDLPYLSSAKAVITTTFNNEHASNNSPGGGAKYQILTTADYGTTPDGSLLNGVYIGADHYVGGATDYVAKLISDDFNVEMFGCYDGQPIADSTIAFDLAIARADSLGGKQINLPRKRIGYEGVNDTAFRVNIAGEAMPDVSPSEGTLVGGSIIVGSFRMRPVQGWFKDFGVDRGFDTFGDPDGGGSTALDAFKVSERGAGDPNFAQKLEVHNVVGLCQKVDSPVHATLVEGYKNARVDNMRGVRGWFGCAIKLRSGLCTNLVGQSSGRNCLIVKADATYPCSELNVIGVIAEGVAGQTSASVAIESLGTQMQRVSINSVKAKNSKQILQIDSDVIINELTTHDWSGNGFNDTTSTGLGTIRSEATIYNWDMGVFKVSNIGANNRAFDINSVRYLDMNSVSLGKTADTNPFYNTDFGVFRAANAKITTNQVTLHSNYDTTGLGTLAFNNTAGEAKETSANWYVKTGAGAPS